MDFNNKWEIVKEIGQGGQGKVYQVINKAIKNETDQSIADFLNNIKTQHVKNIQKGLDNFFDLVYKRLSIRNASFQKALKVLHQPTDSRDYNLAKQRIKNELRAMNDIRHSHLLQIIEYDSDDYWFVSEYYPNGTLKDKLSEFKGNVLYSLKSIRPLVEAVAELHKNNIVHRDIKPENIFVNSKNELILGDFGLVFFDDNNHTRVSNTLSNVGSRDWMPGWAMGCRIEKVNRSFDVFSLGKVIWSMISGKPFLRLWYFNDDENNLEKLFPQKKEMNLVNDLLDKCIVEHEKDCLSSAFPLLAIIDSIVEKLELTADTLKLEGERVCKVCGIGRYILRSDNKKDDQYLGLKVESSSHYLIYICTHCGHTQLFYCNGGNLPQAWES